MSSKIVAITISHSNTDYREPNLKYNLGNMHTHKEEVSHWLVGCRSQRSFSITEVGNIKYNIPPVGFLDV